MTDKPKFKVSQIVSHAKSGREYMIIGTPDRYRIEATGEPAYAYRSMALGQAWVRPQSEFEDGRFVLRKDSREATSDDQLTDDEVKEQVRKAFLALRQKTVSHIMEAETNQDMRQILLDELKEWCGWRRNREVLIDLLRVIENLSRILDNRGL